MHSEAAQTDLNYIFMLLNIFYAVLISTYLSTIFLGFNTQRNFSNLPKLIPDFIKNSSYSCFKKNLLQMNHKLP